MAAADPASDPGNPKPGRSARDKARKIAYGGICAGLALLAMLAVRLLPTADLALYALASLCVAVAIVEIGISGGTAVWMAASILSMTVVQISTGLPFFLLFGPYALIKALVESRFQQKILAAAVKLAAGNVLAAGTGLVFFLFLDMDPAGVPLPWWAVALLIQPVILGFDYALTLLITLYVRRRHPVD